jgi:hypothetical protein
VLDQGVARDEVEQHTQPARRLDAAGARLLDTAGALAWFQITFTDLDVATFGPGIAPFAALGLVDTSLQPKAALAAWDAVFARPRPR